MCMVLVLVDSEVNKRHPLSSWQLTAKLHIHRCPEDTWSKRAPRTAFCRAPVHKT
jgi:hypothetical protein